MVTVHMGQAAAWRDWETRCTTPSTAPTGSADLAWRHQRFVRGHAPIWRGHPKRPLAENDARSRSSSPSQADDRSRMGSHTRACTWLSERDGGAKVPDRLSSDGKRRAAVSAATGTDCHMSSEDAHEKRTRLQRRLLGLRSWLIVAVAGVVVVVVVVGGTRGVTGAGSPSN